MPNLMTQNGLISVATDAYGRSKELTAFICDPVRTHICQIGGITTFDSSIRFKDISEIEFVVQRYIENASTHEVEENKAYSYLHSFCEIHVPELGKRGYFIINSEPRILAESTARESKSFTAYSYESVLQGENLVNFDINQGTETSREIWEASEGEVSIFDTVCLYDPENPKLSLLDLILEDDYYGWQIGHVDGSIASLRRAFSVDNKNVYAFLTGDVSQAFRCIVDFDTACKLINVHDIETVGNSTNIYLSFENFVQQISISPASDNLYTVFNVAGRNGLGIELVNFGSNKIVDISYPLSLCRADIQTRYAAYLAFRDTKRTEYSDAAIDYTNAQSKYNAVMDRQPDDVLNNNWASPMFSLEDLQKELEFAQWYVAEIEGEYTKQDGSIDYDTLNTSIDAATYYSYKRVVIPDLTAEIAKRQSESTEEAATVNQEFVWELYGLNDLKVEKQNIQNVIAAYTAGGWADAYDADRHIDQATYNTNHGEYVAYTTRLSSLNTYIADMEDKAEQFADEMAMYQSTLQSIAQSVSLSGYGFDEGEIALITQLYRESDYSDDNYLITDYDDATSTVAVENDLYEAATKRLAIECHPQIKWSVKSNDLFDIEEFKPLRDSLQVGDFIILGYGVSDAETYVRLRCVQFDFSGLKTDSTFNITFSTATNSKYQNDDYEDLLQNYLTSRTNQISVRATSAASSTASKVANSLIRPYVQIMNAKMQEAEIDQATINELRAVWGKFETVLADYIQADELAANVANINSLTVQDAIVQNLLSSEIVQAALLKVDRIEDRTDTTPHSYWDLTTGELSLKGYVFSTRIEYILGDDQTTAPADNDPGWSTSVPASQEGKYMWQRIVMVESDGSEHPATPVCIQGAMGEDGDDAVVMEIVSTNGNIFKNNLVNTKLNVTVRKGVLAITTLAVLRNVFGASAHLVWYSKSDTDTDFVQILSSDSRLSNDGFTLTLTPTDVNNRRVFQCEVQTN